MPRKLPPLVDARMAVQNMKAEPKVVNGEHPLLASYRRALKRSGLSASTLDQYLSSSANFLAFATTSGFPDITHVRREHIETWEIWMREERHFAPATVRNRFVGLRCWLRWLVDEGELRRDPTERMPMPKVEEVDKDVVPENDVREVIRAMEARAKPRNANILLVRDLAVVGLLYGAGVRATEMCRALILDADLDAGTLYLRATNTKAGEGRTVGLSPTLVTYMDRYLRRRKDNHPQLFVGRRGPMTRSGVYQICRDAFGSTGMTIGPHDVRHTSASHAAETLSDSQMMDVYGWKDVDMPRHYTRQVRKRLSAEAQKRASPLERLG